MQVNLSKLTDQQVRQLFFDDLSELKLFILEEHAPLVQMWLEEYPRTFYSLFLDADMDVEDTMKATDDGLLSTTKYLKVHITMGRDTALFVRDLNKHPMHTLN